MRSIALSIICALVTVLLAEVSHAAAIAVWDINSDTKLRSADLEKLSEQIAAEITASGKYKVVPRKAVKDAIARLQEKYLSDNMYDEDPVMEQLGKSVAAQKHLKTDIRLLGQRCIVTMTLYDATTRLGEKAVTEKGGCEIDELVDSLSLAVSRMTGTQSKLRSSREEQWKPATSGKRVIVRFRASPASALVFLDEKLVCQGTDDCDLEVFVGLHTVSMQAPHYAPRSERITVKPGADFNWDLKPEFAEFSVPNMADVFEVFIDGKSLGKTPLKQRKLRPGKRRVELRSRCYKTTSKIMKLKKGTQITLELKPEPVFSAVDISAVDPSGKSISAQVVVGGKLVGQAPGVFKVPVCATDLLVQQSGFESYSQKLSLQVQKTSKIKAVMGVRQEMVSIPQGKYWYGCNRKQDRSCEPDEFPGKKHYRDSFRLDQTEVTVESYRDCVNAGMCSPPGADERCNWPKNGRDQHPINCVDYFQALVFCSWKNKRLPYAYEYETAARDQKGAPFSWGRKKPNCNLANIGNCHSATVPVKSFPKAGGRFGVYDLHGNVWEWIESGSHRKAQVRGGSFDFDAKFARGTNKHQFPKAKVSSYIGFRCADSLP